MWEKLGIKEFKKYKKKLFINIYAKNSSLFGLKFKLKKF